MACDVSSVAMFIFFTWYNALAAFRSMSWSLPSVPHHIPASRAWSFGWRWRTNTQARLVIFSLSFGRNIWTSHLVQKMDKVGCYGEEDWLCRGLVVVFSVPKKCKKKSLYYRTRLFTICQAGEHRFPCWQEPPCQRKNDFAKEESFLYGQSHLSRAKKNLKTNLQKRKDFFMDGVTLAEQVLQCQSRMESVGNHTLEKFLILPATLFPSLSYFCAPK